MKIFDTHCHLNDKSYRDDFRDVIEAAHKNDVCGFMTVGTSSRDSEQAVKIADSLKGCYASVGVHPHYVADCSHQTLDYLKKLAKHEKVKAWGEIGLDFNRMFSPQQDQERWFAEQLNAAQSAALPVIFHERDSKGRFYKLLKENLSENTKGVVHCFSGSETDLKNYLDLGLYIGITGIFTMKERGAKLRELAASIPRTKILIETDAPYLIPPKRRKMTKRNEPAFVKDVLSRLAEVLKENPESLAERLWENSLTLFNIQ